MKEMADFLRRAGAGGRMIFGLALFVVSVISPLFIRRLPTLRSLDVPERVEALTRMEESFAAAPVLAVKASSASSITSTPTCSAR